MGIIPNGSEFAEEVKEFLWRNVVATARSVRDVSGGDDGMGVARAYLRFFTNKALSIDTSG